ncbi:hypothetical protein V6N11_050764 [Hibiscus sabdariffa]|uniref:Uncharacterized protein n=2 Tax=Hibiscus sabdariffa TaxID=183260 RepID=A0ABR2A3P6_9ROSI
MSTYQEAIINVEVKEAISKVKAKEATTNVEEKEEISKDEVQVEKTKAETKGHEKKLDAVIMIERLNGFILYGFILMVMMARYEGRRGGGSNHRNICGSLARIRSNQSLGIAKANNQSSLITGQDLLKPVLQGEV